jgi:hypothetical protein
MLLYNYIPAPRRGRGYTVLPLSVCPSFRPSFHPSVLPSVQDIFRRTFLSNCFGPIRFLLPVCRLCWFLFTLNIYAHFSSHFSQQLLMAEIWYLVTSFILWEAFLDPSDSYFLFADFVGFYTHSTYMHIFRHIFLSNYWWQRSDIWSQASYRYHISWETFLEPSDSYLLFAQERGYHKWALAHSSSCCNIFHEILPVFIWLNRTIYPVSLSFGVCCLLNCYSVGHLGYLFIFSCMIIITSWTRVTCM